MACYRRGDRGDELLIRIRTRSDASDEGLVLFSYLHMLRLLPDDFDMVAIYLRPEEPHPELPRRVIWNRPHHPGEDNPVAGPRRIHNVPLGVHVEELGELSGWELLGKLLYSQNLVIDELAPFLVEFEVPGIAGLAHEGLLD